MIRLDLSYLMSLISPPTVHFLAALITQVHATAIYTEFTRNIVLTSHTNWWFSFNFK